MTSPSFARAPEALNSEADVAAAMERTRASYDEAPYRSAPLARCHPARMAANARYLGLTPPTVVDARILEIGCASGGHLIPLAAQFPEARFLGVDLSPVQIADGQARVARLGLGNVTLAARSLSDLGPDDGEFDYIVCHGVYSWIPEAIRDELMRVCKARLSPHGLAMISYNVLPGWRLLQIARDSLQIHAGAAQTLHARTAQARRLFELMAELTEETRSYGQFWRNEAKRMASADDAYLAHEIFEDFNAPCTFGDFAARAGRNGLAYLCETCLAANVAQALISRAAPAIAELAGADPQAQEQYIDLFSGRSFRESLLVHAERAASIDRSANLARIADFHLVAPLGLAAAQVEGAADEWTIGDGGDGVVCGDPEVVAAIERLIAHLPSSSRLEDIVAAGATAAQKEALAATLTRLLKFGHLDIATEAIACAIGDPQRPKAWSVAASDARVADATTTLRHAPFQMTALQRFLLLRLDGMRTRDELVGLVVEEGVRGNLKINGPEGLVTERDKLTAILAPHVDEALAVFVRVALLSVDK